MSFVVANDQGGNPTLRLQFAGGCAMGDGQNLLFVYLDTNIVQLYRK